jgi:hypothetical protein
MHNDVMQEHMKVVPEQLRALVRVRELRDVSLATEDTMIEQALPHLCTFFSVSLQCRVLETHECTSSYYHELLGG